MKNCLMTKRIISYLALAIATLMLAVACNSNTNLITTQVDKTGQSSQDNVLEIWWDKGFTSQEDEALQKVISNWEKKTGNKIKLTFYTTDERWQKTQRHLQAGSPPDIFMGHKTESTLTPQLAWEGKLADVSDVIEQVKDLYSDTVIKTASYYNNADNKQSYYAVPIFQSGVHFYYWKDLLKQAGKSEQDIPQDWDGFWAFWKQVQDNLNAKQSEKIYALGLPMSVEAGDTYQTFEHILEAYDVQILDSEGQLKVDAPQVRQGIITCLDWYIQSYRDGYILPEAVKWLNPDNNRDFLNREILMTPNATLSISTAIRQEPETYTNKLGILEFPNKPSGKPMRHLVIVEQAIVFAQSQNQESAKDFLAYLIQPENINNYLKAAEGRHSPVLKTAWKDSFWTNPKDPHISTVTKTLTNSNIKTFGTFQNPAYSVVLNQNVWGQALTRMVKDNISPEQAADEAIAQIKEIFANWK